MQKGMPNFYEYAGQKYSINFPVHWAANHMEGTGPLDCSTCNEYGCDNGIFKNYCIRCLIDSYPNTDRYKGDHLSTTADMDGGCDGDDDDITTIISDCTEDIDYGIGCNRCYSCVTGGAGPCVLNLESSIGSDDEADNIDGVETQLDPSNMLSNSFNSSIYRNPNSSSLRSIDVSCTFEDEYSEEKNISTEYSCTFEDEYSEEKNRSSVAPSFIAPSSVSNDIADEINRYIQENPIEQPDDTYEYGITNGYEFGHDAFDTANGYCSY